MQAKRRQPIGNYVVELLVVNDQAQVIKAKSKIMITVEILSHKVQRFDGNVQATVMRTMEIVNGMNSVSIMHKHSASVHVTFLVVI